MSTARGQHLLGKELGSCILEKLLGYGGSSAVFLARQISTQDEVAVKVFLPRPNVSARMQRNFYIRFLREAEAASQLDHPHILMIYSYGEQDGLPYIVMPYMPGGTLSEYVLKHGPLSLQEAQRYLEQIASALDYAHEHNCVHCDVKPANILLDGEGNAFLSDFGIAHLTEPDRASPQQAIRSSDTLMGTPEYISPEQALGQKLDGRSDIYSLGVTLYFLLAGKPPFKADDSITMAIMQVHDTPPALGLVRADVTPFIDRVLGKALAKWPENRYQTAGEFAAAFTKAVDAASDSTAPHFNNEGAENILEDGPISDGAARATAKVRPYYTTKESTTASAAQPSVSVRRIERSTPRLSIKAFLVALLLALLVSSVLTAGVINSLRTSHPIAQRPSPKVTITPSSFSNLFDDKENWVQSSDFFFRGEQYHIKNSSPNAAALSVYDGPQYNNFLLTISMSELQVTQITKDNTPDFYGLVFRANFGTEEKDMHYYLFEISASEGGRYGFWRYDGAAWKSIVSGPLPTFKQRNIISIEAKNNTFTFSINGMPIENEKEKGKPITDPSKSPLGLGFIGLYVEKQGTEVVFSDLHVQQVK